MCIPLKRILDYIIVNYNKDAKIVINLWFW